MKTDPKSATNEELQIQAETLAQLLGAAILRLKELGEKSWELPPYAKRLVSNVESVAGGSQPVDREHERRYETVETLDGTHDAEIPAVRPNSTPHPAPSAASGLAASSKCPICGNDSPHAHVNETIHEWLKAQATRFGLDVFVCDIADVKSIKRFELSEEHKLSSRGDFERWTLTVGVPMGSTFNLRRSHNQPECYMALNTEFAWAIWRAALRSHQAPVGEDKDGERYRWFNKNYDFLAYVRGEDGQKTYRLRCGEPLNAWIDREIEKERARQAAAPSPQTGGGS